MDGIVLKKIVITLDNGDRLAYNDVLVIESTNNYLVLKSLVNGRIVVIMKSHMIYTEYEEKEV